LSYECLFEIILSYSEAVPDLLRAMLLFVESLLFYLMPSGFLAVSVQQVICVPANRVSSISCYPPAETIELIIYELTLQKLACRVVIVADTSSIIHLWHKIDESA